MISALQTYLAKTLLQQAIHLPTIANSLGINCTEIEGALDDLIRQGMKIEIHNNIAHLNHPDPIHSKQTNTFIHIHYSMTTSTQDIVRAMEPRKNKLIAVSSDFQITGRGQHSNQWLSSYGNHILMSLLIPKIDCTIPWSLMAGYIVQNWLSKRFHLNHIMIKWPNDIMINDLKLCGILHEAHKNPNYLVMGIGLNVHSDPYISANSSVTQPATTLGEVLGISLCREEILSSLIQVIHDTTSTPGAIEKLQTDLVMRYNSFDYFLNKPIKTTSNHTNHHGIGRGISDDGQYLIETFDGMIVKINSASIRLERRT